MRLVVPFPSEWRIEPDDGYLRAIVPGHLAEPDLFLLVSDVRGLPPTIDTAFFTHEVALDAPPGTRPEVEGVRDDRSLRGWPLTLVRAAMMAGGVIVEQRLAAFYRLIDSYAAVIVVGRDPQRWKDLVEGLGEIVLAADLDWSGTPASLAEILGLDADHAIFQRS